MLTEQEIAERLDRLEQPYRAMSKEIAEGVLAALKESGQTIAARSDPNAQVEQQAISTRDNEVAHVVRYELPDIPGVCAIIGALPTGAIINEKALSKILNKNPRTIRRAVQRGELPPPVLLAGNSTWTVGAIINHVEKRLESAAKKDEQWRRKLASHLP